MHGIFTLMSAPSVLLHEFSILRKHKLCWQLPLQCPQAAVWSTEAAGSKGNSWTAVLLSSDVWGETPDSICKVRSTWPASLTLWESWTKPHPLDLTSWDEQLFDDHDDKRLELMPPFSLWLSLQKTQCQPDLARKSPTGRASEAWRQHYFCRQQHPISNLGLLQQTSHTEVCREANKKCMKKSHCVAHRSLITN